MSKGTKEKKDNATTIAIIGLVGTLIAALLGSPVLVELIKDKQATETPPTDTETKNFTEQTLIFREDFDNDTVSGFSYEGYWQVGKEKNNLILETSQAGKATFGPSDFTNGMIEFRLKIQDNSGNGAAAINFRESGDSAYALALAENQLKLGHRHNKRPVQSFSGESTRSLAFEKGAWYLIRVEVRGPEIVVFVDNNRIMSAIDNQLSTGGLSFSVDEGMQVSFDDINVWELK